MKNIWAKLYMLLLLGTQVLLVVYMETNIDSLGIIAVVLVWLSVIFAIVAHITSKK